MKRTRFLTPCTLAALALGALAPAAASAVDLLPYFLPGTNRLVSMQSGEVFHTKRATINGRQGFYLVKSQDGRGYEEFWYDDTFIYHLRDTTWATGPNQNIKCIGTNQDAFFTILEGNFGTDSNNPCATWNAHKSQEKGKWVRRNMNAGETLSSLQTVIGFSKSGCGCCNTDYDGYGGERIIQFVSLDFRGYPGWSGQVARFAVTKGPGTGDNFYYGQDVGLLGFEIRPATNPINGAPTWSNFPTSITTGTLTENQYCPRPGLAPLTISNPSTGITTDLWITHCISGGQQRVWRVSTDRRLADYLYTEGQYDACGTPDPTFGGYPLKFRTAFPVANIWITYCAGSGHTEWVWKTNGTQYAPFQYPQYNGLCP